MNTDDNVLQKQTFRSPDLRSLPPELLIHIVSHLENAQTVARLSQTCRSLQKFTRREGWRAFLRTSFPSISVPSGLEEHSEVAHSLTSLSRAWDRKAFIARYTGPDEVVIDGTTGKRIVWKQRPSGQTMGYQPCIDSHERWTGSRWTDKTEILAWSAGAQLMLRVKETRSDRVAGSPRSAKESASVDEFGHSVSWYTWKRAGGQEGRDDITTLNLIKKDSVYSNDEEKIVIGTANGALDLLHAVPGKGRISSHKSFATNGRPVRSADVSDDLLIACLSDSSIAAYSLSNGSSDALDELDAMPNRGRDRRCWSTKFLSNSKVAIGLGISKKPIHIYEITPAGLSNQPVRTFGLGKESFPIHPGQTTELEQKEKSSSVYPVLPLPGTAAAAHRPGEVFLSGCFDGIIRLHDMRSPAPYVGIYQDPNDDSSIYCLQTLGRERLVAGSSRYSMMKFFDLRVSGGRVYHYMDAAAATLSSKMSTALSLTENHVDESDGWNLFINPRNRNTLPRASTAPRHRRNLDSPVYSLSSPSSSSSSLYAGVENNVVQFDFLSILDRHPDPIYSSAVKRIPKSGRIDIRGSWNPRGNVLNLGMYEQNGVGAVRLRVQKGIGKYEGSLKGLDERWTDGSEA